MKPKTQHPTPDKPAHKKLAGGLILIAGIVALLGSAHAIDFGQDPHPEGDAPPMPADPVVFPAQGTRFRDFYSSEQFNFAIDPASISVQSNNEIRYALKVSSKQGAVNISYEGIQCATNQKILYATGQSDGSWTAARSPKWSEIFNKGANLQHSNLVTYYFCLGDGVAGRVSDIRSRFEMNRPMSN